MRLGGQKQNSTVSMQSCRKENILSLDFFLKTILDNMTEIKILDIICTV